MSRFIVYSLDMWGHVPADCCAAYGCKCINVHDEEMHNEDTCECHEDMNDRFRLGTLDAEGADDASLVATLIAEGYLDEAARTLAVVDDCGDGTIGIHDSKGRAVLYLASTEGDESHG